MVPVGSSQNVHLGVVDSVVDSVRGSDGQITESGQSQLQNQQWVKGSKDHDGEKHNDTI